MWPLNCHFGVLARPPSADNENEGASILRLRAEWWPRNNPAGLAIQTAIAAFSLRMRACPVTIAAAPSLLQSSVMLMASIDRSDESCLLIKRARPSTRVTAPSLAASADAASAVAGEASAARPITLSGGHRLPQ